MKSVLDVTVSCFRNFRETEQPQPVNLLHWLHSVKYAGKVDAIRNNTDKASRDAAKATLPAITPSGEFSRREASALIRHSSLICLDIDLKGNEAIGNYSDLKREFCKIRNVAYCGLSVSGTGFFLLIPIAYPDQHLLHFQELQRLFYKNWRVVIDKACSDVSRLRGYSYDAEGFFRHDAEPFRGLYVPPVRKQAVRQASHVCEGETAPKVEALVSLIEQNRIDITSDYNDWLKIGFSLANEFGESGREFMHRISQFHASYDADECDKKYDRCLRDEQGRTHIGTLFTLCQQQGIELPRLTLPTQPPQPTVIQSLSEWQPGQLVRFNESKVERLITEPCDTYPPEWDEPNAPDAVPTLKAVPCRSASEFHKWQQQHPYFGQMGLASLTPKQQATLRGNT
jgi:hypothetical protein